MEGVATVILPRFANFSTIVQLAHFVSAFSKGVCVMSKIYYRVFNGTNQLLVSTQSLSLAKAVLTSADPARGPYLFFVGGYAEDVTPFLLTVRSTFV